jgi:hypothetical protein
MGRESRGGEEEEREKREKMKEKRGRQKAEDSGRQETEVRLGRVVGAGEVT